MAFTDRFEVQVMASRCNDCAMGYDPRFESRERERRFSLLQVVQTGSGANLASGLVGTGVLFRL
jgi:hypothetical protein